MTINIALISSEALVFGCDSISSSIGHFVNPAQYLVMSAGGPALGEDGLMTARFPPDAIQPVVTHSFAGVAKMFQISSGQTEVAAVTAGLAKVGDQTIWSIADEFHHHHGQENTNSVLETAKSFAEFVKGKFDHCFGNNVIASAFVPDVIFLVGGYDDGSAMPSLFQVSGKTAIVTEQLPGGQCGVTWTGQADSVERLIFGIDSNLSSQMLLHANGVMDTYHEATKTRMVEVVEQLMKAGGLTELPEGFSHELVPKPVFAFNKSNGQIDIDFDSLTLQDAVDFVSFLVNLQAGKSKFVRGVATVGGRTHIGILRKNRAFEMLNEPPLTHRNTGYGHDV